MGRGDLELMCLPSRRLRGMAGVEHSEPAMSVNDATRGAWKDLTRSLRVVGKDGGEQRYRASLAAFCARNLRDIKVSRDHEKGTTTLCMQLEVFDDSEDMERLDAFCRLMGQVASVAAFVLLVGALTLWIDDLAMVPDLAAASGFALKMAKVAKAAKAVKLMLVH